MVKVQCILNYFDKQLGKNITTKDEAFEVSSERAKQLVDAKVCKVIEVIQDEPKEELVEEVKVKKTTRKKK